MAGYAKISRIYLWAFFVLCIISGVISTGAVALLCAVILGQILPWELSTLELSCIVMVTSGILLVAGHYRLFRWFNQVDYRPADSSDGCSCVYRCR